MRLGRRSRAGSNSSISGFPSQAEPCNRPGLRNWRTAYQHVHWTVQQKTSTFCRKIEKEKNRHMNGKVALVTGGARGIGAATAKILGQRGASVVVNYLHNQEAAEAVVAEIK